jgi:hypothetical protein
VADGEGPSVERDAWMSEQVAGEIEELRRRFGFERKEAVAYWHFRHARQLMSEMGQTDHFKELEREGRSELEADFREFVCRTNPRHLGVRRVEGVSALCSAIQRTRCPSVAKELPGRMGPALRQRG